MTAILEAKNLRAAYGDRPVIFGIDLVVPQGGIVALLGANGAGKTTTLRALLAQTRTWGEITYQGQRINGASTQDLVRMGMVMVPEGRGTFVDFTVEENLRLGAYSRRDGDGIRKDLERVYHYFPVLARRRNQRAGSMSGGEQQMLAIGRALMARPKLLLLDEPSLGLAPLIVQEIFQILTTINREEGVSMLLVEQDAVRALKVASYAYLLETGRVAMEGPAAQLAGSEDVRRAYLGY
ncbi:ABC transporter ATP-binding protein [Tepidiforma thermophila]|uniref:Amino acid/amide ABC transporter ATP-binding protein 2, HAAT family n=1 Tax=Tepidiforma thermophila (strain KCTC 52669 / CGMCC 1.13589 / G233) TaxID=2761530 RepID=A0A2A9HEA8_TEPT2|nr:ABC transporter ATP-binding protein [Tepidiforma thermophila]PFG73316.1 amino acid/amide ABC transporter ATP-binding protein 2, HAAT family [Tepidiforma thermophila]